MPSEHIVVDGSNIATEGRNTPSLAQLEEAVSELRRENPEAEITVIVDATFAHRIEPAELERFEGATLAGEYVHPPAGAIGRGDAFLLRVAEKVDAIVLSNDSFQEFHGEHPWLFERGRLIGATPVPGVGWIFSPRTPVRGPKSRRAVKDTEREKRKLSKAIEAATKEAVSARPPTERAPRSRRTVPASGNGERANGSRPRSQPSSMAAAVNDPLTFISFIAEHPLGAEVSGRVDSYTSHGAVVFVGGVRCYVPLANMAAPAPRSAREVLKREEERTFVVTALDPQRRGVELALPGIAQVSGRPSEETIAAEVKLAKRPPAQKAARKAAGAKKATAPRTRKAVVDATPSEGEESSAAPQVSRSRRGATPADEAPAAPDVPRKAPAAAKKPPARKAAAAAPAAAKRSPASDRAPRRGVKKTGADGGTTRTASAADAEKAAAPRRAAKKSAPAPEGKRGAAKKSAAAKKTTAAKRTASGQKGAITPAKAESTGAGRPRTRQAATRSREP